MLSDTAIKNAKPCLKPDKDGGNPIPIEGDYKMHDSAGLYLLVKKNGGKWWRVDYRFDGKRQTLSVGTYPDTSLREARLNRDRIRDAVKAGINPAIQRKAEAIRSDSGDTFETVAREWHGKKSATWSEEHAKRTIERFERDVFPFIGSMPMADIDAPTLLVVLQRMEARGVSDSVLRVRENCGAVFRYGGATGRCTADPAHALHGAIIAKPVKHHAAIIDPKRFGQLLKDIDAYEGTIPVQCALRLSPLLALRPGEVRNLEWDEIHLDTREIRIPAAKMKMKSDHIVPLSTQAVSIFLKLKELTGNGKYALPSSRSPRGDKPMSENTVNAALRYLGYEKSLMSAHGFRGSFCSLANEKLKFSSDAIERQLAHAERSKVRAAYLHTEFMDERRELMQAWADYLDQLRAYGSNVVSIKAVG